MSGLLDGAQLAMARSLLGQYLHGTCTIIAVVESGSTQTWPGPGVTVSCTKGNPATGGDPALMYDGNAEISRFWIPMGTVIKTGDRLIYGGITYKVEGLPSAHADELLRPVDCIEVRTPGGAPA